MPKPVAIAFDHKNDVLVMVDDEGNAWALTNMPKKDPENPNSPYDRSWIKLAPSPWQKPVPETAAQEGEDFPVRAKSGDWLKNAMRAEGK